MVVQGALRHTGGARNLVDPRRLVAAFGEESRRRRDDRFPRRGRTLGLRAATTLLSLCHASPTRGNRLSVCQHIALPHVTRGVVDSFEQAVYKPSVGL
jgi:hypothetical protein